MLNGKSVWLAANAASGSNSEEALQTLEAAFAAAGCTIGRRLDFHRHGAPDAGQLREAGVDLLVTFTGDGTMNALVTGVYGWEGAVLVLPGGTMNLLSRRLHGDTAAAEIIGRVAAGRYRRIRPTVVRSPQGDGLSGTLAGPGTTWNRVREAMRETDVLGTIASAADAIGESARAPRVICREPPHGRDEGYSLMMLTPTEQGITLDGYYAETVADYARHGIALLRRNFRDGPHDTLGTFPTLRLACPEGDQMGLLLDGEPLDAPDDEEFVLARCEVDLLATGEGHGG